MGGVSLIPESIREFELINEFSKATLYLDKYPFICHDEIEEPNFVLQRYNPISSTKKEY